MHFFTRGVTISAVGEACKSPDVPLDPLTRQRALFDGLFARVPEAIVLLDTDERILQVNPEFTRLFGYAQEEACGRLINELVVPEELLAEAEEYARDGLRRERLNVEAVRKHKDGTRVHVSIVSGPVSVAGSQIAEYVIYRDITERKRAEQRLQKSEAYLEEAQRLSQTGSWAWSPAAGDIRYWSDTCYRVLGFDPAGPLPRFEEFFHRIHPDDQAASSELFEQSIRDKTDFELDYRIVHPEKGSRDIHAVGHAVLDGSGSLGEFVGTVIDVTERKRAEQELRQREADLRTKNDRLKLLLNVTSQITSNLNLRELLRAVSSSIREVMHCDAVFVSLVDPASGTPRLYVLDFPHGKGLIKEEIVYTISAAGKRVLETLKPSVVDLSDPAAVPPEIYDKVVAEGLKSACLILLVNRGRVLGGLVIARKTEASFTPDDLEFLAQVSGQIAIAVENALAFQEVSGLRDRLQLLLNLTTKITSTLDLREVLRAVAANVRELIHADAATVSLPDATSGKFRLFAVDFPHGRGGIKEELLYTPGAASRKAADTMKPVVGYAPELDERESSEVRDIAAAEGMKAFCLIPLVTRGRFLGILSILRTTQTPFTPQDVDLLTQASGQIAIAVENALAYHEISELKDKLAQEKLYLEEEEKKLRRVFESMPTMVWTAGADGGNEFGNRRWQEYTGLSDEKTVGSGWQDAIYPTDLKQHWEKWCASRASGEPFENEVRYRRAADGQYRWFLSRAVPVRDGKGNIVRWYGVSTDIEDRKSAESLLAGEKRILEMLAKGDSLGEILDALCRFVEAQANGVLASVLLLDEGRLQHGGAPSLPKVYTDAIDGTVVGPSAGSCGTAAYRGEQVIVEDIATDPLWANYRELALPHSLRACWSTPILSSQGKVIATFAMYYREPRRPTKRDQEIIEQITHLAGAAIERKLTQDKLQRSEAFLAEAQHLSRTGSFGWNVSSGEIFWSEETYKIFEYDRAVKPTAELVLQRVHPEDRGLVQQTIDRVTNERTNFDLEHRLLMPDGSVKYLHVLGGALEPTSGDLEFVGAVTDVTERTRSEEALRQMQAHLAHLNRVSTMGELTASLAHEIKQPIGAAVTNAGACVLLLGHDHPDLAEAREAASEMVKDARRAADIVDRVRLLFQKRSSQLEVADVNEIVGEMVVMLQNEANRHSVTMRTDLVEGLPKVMADRVQLQQALMNLMLNGMEAMRDGSGMLSIKSQLAEDGQLLISVTDSGMGLPAENTGKIFDAFFTTKSQGTGLGLAITRSIIEAHGGRIWATANPERGATFSFTLPCSLAFAA